MVSKIDTLIKSFIEAVSNYYFYLFDYHYDY